MIEILLIKILSVGLTLTLVIGGIKMITLKNPITVMYGIFFIFFGVVSGIINYRWIFK